MAHQAGIGAHGLWSISRGLARGLDGRGNLSQRALIDFSRWFLRVCLEEITFMSGLFEPGTLARRLRALVEQRDSLKLEAARLLEEALIRGEIERGDMPRITGWPEHSARRVLSDVVAAGLLGSDTPKGKLSLRFPVATLDTLFPES